MRRTMCSILASLALSPVACALTPSLFAPVAGGARLALHPSELPGLERVSFDLPSGSYAVDLRLLERRGPDSFTMVGTHPDMPMLHAMVTVEGPAVSALLTHPDLGTHRFEHTEAGTARLYQVALPDIPWCGCDCSTHEAHLLAPSAGHRDTSARAATAVTPVGRSAPATPPGVVPCTDDLARIDVLVLYTQKAIDLAGGDENAVRASIQMGIDEFNLASQNATVVGTAPRANLVHSAFTPYAETTTSSSTHLSRLREIGDGQLDDAHTLRETHKADVVILVGGAMDVCVRAFIGVLAGNTPRPDLAFGVVNYNCTNAPTYAFAHELGHILGALHNPESDYCDTGAQPYAKGYVAPDESYATIMASGTTAPRIPYFSDADASFMGMPVGDTATASNGAAFRMGAATTVAQYRLIDCNANGVCDEDEIAMGMVDDLDMNGVPDDCQRDEDANGVADGVEIAADPSLDLDSDGMLDSVEQPVRYVDVAATGLGTGLSWGDAHPTIQEAIDAVLRSGGDIQEVWVATGTYFPTDSTTARAVEIIVPSGTTLYGSFAGSETHPDQRDIDANPTVVSADLLGNDLPGSYDGHLDNVFTLMRFSNATGVVVDGFTFEGGYGDTNSNCGFYNYGGGVFAFFSDFELRHCTFRRNGGNNGGGLAVTDGSVARVIGCDFIENVLVPVDFLTAAGNIITREGIGAGAYIINAPNPENNAYIENCRFLGNTVGSALASSAGAPTIVGSLFTGNSSRVAVIANSSTGGSDATFINCTIVNNTGTGFSSYAGIRNFRSDITLINTIVWGNTGTSGATLNTQIANDAGSTTTARNSIVQFATNANESYMFTDVADADPLFSDPAMGDFTLGAMSPAIDAGDTGALDGFALLTDLAGNERFADDPSVLDTGLASLVDPVRPIVDIGAYERHAGTANACIADFDNDGDVDLGDFGFFGSAFGSTAGDPTYSPDADFDNDNDVDLGDFGAFGSEFGRSDCL
ncbi:MAG: hypothetical protein Tsb0013_06020 [Phycisphaerales bacterium]